jgi:hypothetical protein
MAFKFNPFTGTLDQTGSGGGASYIDGEVQNFSALPETIGTPAVDSAYLVREAEGTWLLARKPAGIYIRTADTGVRAADWTHASAFPDVFSDAAFTVFSDGDSTKNLQLSLSGITTGTVRTLTAPDASGTIQLTGHAAEHATGGSDALTPANIGAAPAVNVIERRRHYHDHHRAASSLAALRMPMAAHPSRLICPHPTSGRAAWLFRLRPNTRARLAMSSSPLSTQRSIC